MDDVRGFETYLAAAGAQAVELIIRFLKEVTALNPHLFTEAHLTRAEFLVSVDILRDNSLAFAFVIGNNEFDGIKNSAYTGCCLFEVLADDVFQESLVDHSLHLGITNLIHEGTDGLRGITATTQAAYSRHTRIIPSGYKTFLDEL